MPDCSANRPPSEEPQERQRVSRQPDHVHDLAGNPEEPLGRLLADVSLPWWRSLGQNLAWLFSAPAPPIRLTSCPVPVKGIWSESQRNSLSLPLSLLIHTAAIGLLILAVPKLGNHFPKLVPSSGEGLDVGAFLPTALKELRGGGGGGDRSPLPASKGVLPRFDWMQLAPPSAVVRNENPRLQVEANLIGPPELDMNLAGTQIGDPLGSLGPRSNGPGSRGGIGSGDDGGVGPRRGPGAGPDNFGLVYRPGGGVVGPKVLSSVEPEFTDEARKAKHQGTVVLTLVVGTDGRAHDVRVMQGLGLGLDQKAVAAVQQWRFRPGTKGGVPVPVAARVEVTFRLL